MKFEIDPYVGPLPLRFGINEAQVAKFIGPPSLRMTSRIGNPDHDHGFCAVGYDKDTLLTNHFGFRPPTKIIYKDIPMFSNPDALRFMIAEDGEPFEFVGFVLLLNLGVSFSGFHDKDEAQLAVNMFERGRFEKFRNQFKPFRLN